jgi:chitinase
LWVGAASIANRATFVRNLVDFAAEHGFDGFDLDWEPFDAFDRPLLQGLAEALRVANPAFILTLPGGWVSATNPNVDSFCAQISRVVDQINIMSYGMAGTWSGWHSWHSSALAGHTASTPSSVSSSAEAFIEAGVPAAKLGIGIGFYGACWAPPVTGPGQSVGGSEVVAGDNTMSYRDIIDRYFSAASRHWDNVAKVPYLSFGAATGPQQCTFVSYDDAESILAKGTYARQTGLGGTIIWTVNQGHLPNRPAGQRDPLLAATKRAFLD